MKTSEAIKALEKSIEGDDFHNHYLKDKSAIQHAIDFMRRYSWQPIETAPKDGTHILIRYKEKVSVCSWARQAFPEGRMTWCAQDCCDGITIYPDATQWMPLPQTEDVE